MHHLSALLQVIGVVVGVAYLVVITVCQLTLNPVAVIAAPIQFGAQQVAKAVTGLAVFVTHQAQGLVDGVLAHRSVSLLLPWEQQGVAATNFLKLAQDGYCLAW
ncbi:hypothetical protein D9M68_972080 [compost metagenome]